MLLAGLACAATIVAVAGRLAGAGVARDLRLRVWTLVTLAAVVLGMAASVPAVMPRLVGLGAVVVAVAACAVWRQPGRLRTWSADIGEAVVVAAAVVVAVPWSERATALGPWAALVAGGWAAIGLGTGMGGRPEPRARLAVLVAGASTTVAAVLVGAAGWSATGASASRLVAGALLLASTGVVGALAIVQPLRWRRLVRRSAIAGTGSLVVVAAALVVGLEGDGAWVVLAVVGALLVDGVRPTRRRGPRVIDTARRLSGELEPNAARETLMVIDRLTDPLAAQTQVVQALGDLFPGRGFELLRSARAPLGLLATKAQLPAALEGELVRRGGLVRGELDDLPSEVERAFDALGGTLLLPVSCDSTTYGALLVHDAEPRVDIVVQVRRFADLLGSKLEIHRLYSELQQKERLATVGAFSAALLHDLRNPLGAVLLNLQFLGRSTGQGVDREALADAMRALDRVLADLAGTLDYTRPLALDVGTVDAARLAAQVVEEHRRDAAAAGARLVLRSEDALPPIRGDEGRLRRVLENLVRNALEVAPADSEVVVEVALHDEGVEIRVTDQGPGIAASVVDRVFEPFVSTKATGVGLGLAIVKKIVECHRGTVEAESLRRGTCMRVWIPIAT